MTSLELQREFLTSGNRIAPEDFFILLAHATSKEKAFLLAHPEYLLNTAEETTFRDFLERRRKHEPVAYIVGSKEFYGHTFSVTQDTLIPRPETELLIERVSHTFKENPLQSKDILDIGTGSGNIIITLSLETKTNATPTRFFGIDISSEALEIAKKNALTNKRKDSIIFLKGDLLAPYLPYQEEGREIIIAANLPYLSASIYNNTSPDIHDFEPMSALVSEKAGLAHYYRLLEEVKDIQSQVGAMILFLEISPEQTTTLIEKVTSLFPQAKIETYKDLAQKDRLIEICLKQA